MSKKKQTTKQDVPVLNQALEDLNVWCQSSGLAAVRAPEKLESVTAILGEQFADLLRQPDIERMTEQIPTLLSSIRRARAVSEDEVALLLCRITEVFDAAIAEARKTIKEARRARESIQQFEEKKKREILEEVQRARHVASKAAEDFTGHVDSMRAAEKTAKSIQTVLGAMRGHAANMRQAILQNIEDGNYESAASNIKALFAFYDVDLKRRFDEPGEIIFGRNLQIAADDTITLNGKTI
jgi:RNA polymerase-binding transcription factor DksA